MLAALAVAAAGSSRVPGGPSVSLCTGKGNLSDDWNGRRSARTNPTSCLTTEGRLRGFPMLE